MSPTLNHWQSHCNAESNFLDTLLVALSMNSVFIFIDAPHGETTDESRFFGVRVSRLFNPGKLVTLSRLSTFDNWSIMLFIVFCAAVFAQLL